MTKISQEVICEALNQYCFKHIWNDVVSETRHNIEPYPVNVDRSVVGYCNFGLSQLELPTKHDHYYTFKLSNNHAFGSFYMPLDSWTNSRVLCNEFDLLIHTYNSNGTMIPKSDCYFINVGQQIILAVKKTTFKKILGKSKKIYLTIYSDSDEVGNTRIYDKQNKSDYDLENLIYFNGKNHPHRLKLFVDGFYRDDYEKVITELPTINNLDVIVDTDVVGKFTVDVIKEPHTYYSKKDKLYKSIIHIPKELNPENEVITHNTCQVFCKDASGKGTYLHFTENNSATQITHNDFSVPVFIIDAHKDYLNTDTLSLDVFIKTHGKNNKLIRNSAYVEILYETQTDDEILSHLQGKLSNDLDFWRASYLEDHNYTKMMFDVPDFATPKNIDYYIEALGYYHVAALLCQRVRHFTLDENSSRRLSILKPYIWSNDRVIPIVYLNGTKLFGGNYSITHLTSNEIIITLADHINITDNTEVVVYFYPKGDLKVIPFTPTDDNTAITVPMVDFDIYKKKDHGNISIKSMYDKTSISYLKTEIEAGKISVTKNEDGTSQVSFSSDYVGQTFYLLSSVYTTYRYKDLSDDIKNDKTFVIDLYTEDNEANKIPLLNVKDVEVYFNGKYLIEDLDYKLVKVDAYDGSYAYTKVVVQNMSYGDDTHQRNVVEVIASSLETSDTDLGYVLNNIASRDMDIDLYFRGLSTLHVNGYYEHKVRNTGVGLELKGKSYEDGKPFGLKTAIPSNVKEALLPFTGKIATDRIKKIEDYLKSITVEDKDVILSESHRIYSSYLNYLIGLLVDKKIALAYDPIDEKMLDQLKDYEYLKQFDVFFSNRENINLRFVDIYPTYSGRLIDDDQIRMVIHKLKDLLIGNEPDTSGVVVDD